MTHRVELGTLSRVPSTSKKKTQKTTNPKPKLPNQNHPSNIHKTFHGVFQRYYSLWQKIKTDVVISTNLQSCTGDYMGGTMNNLTFNFKVFAKNLQPFSVLSAKENF